MRQTRRSIAAKIQAVAGTPETLTAADVFFAEDIQLSPEVEQLMRPHHLPTISQLAPVAGRSRMSASCKVPMYGASAAGTAPFWGMLLQGCGWAETIVALTSAKYLPATTGHKILTLKVFVDGVSFRIRDAKGSWSIEFKAGSVPYFSFKFDGIWEPLTDADAFKDEALLEGNALPSFQPKPFKAALLSIGGTHFGVSEGFKLDSGNKLVYVP
ncbi:MAG: hypothetical protein OEW15_18915, partial [Nitrospirota bacterium]|nr:hypothetical protein [Nitrospirota bacterium]